jgi:hypothetical protein
MFARDESDQKQPARGPCAKVVAAVFGTLFLIALLAVPVTTTTSRLRQDQGSNIVTRTTYPRKATVFLPQYLSMRARPRQGRTVEIRAAQWTATMGIVAVLGLFDYFVFCRVLRRRRPVKGQS